MKRILFILALFCFLPVMGYGTPCPTGYAYAIPISVPPQTGMSANVTNFPFIWRGNSYTATTANGGYSQDSGIDVTFCDASTGGTLLSYERAPNSYVGTTGASLWAVSLPTLYHTTTTAVIYALVGNSSPTDYSCTTLGNCSTTVWANYLIVDHFVGGSLYNSVDGTTGTNHGTTANTTGPLGEGLTFVGSSSQWADTGEVQTGLTAFTEEAWVYLTDSATAAFWASSRSSSEQNGTFLIQVAEDLGIGYAGETYYYTTSGEQLGTSGPYAYIAGSHTAGSSNQVSLYINGAPITGIPEAGGTTTDPINSGQSQVFGRDGGYDGYYATGYMAEYRKSNVAQSANWILATYNSVSSPSTFYFNGTLITIGGSANRARVTTTW